MKKIFNFSQFINEKYQLDPNDAPEITSQKHGFNDMEACIKEYQNKKITLDNIYKTYKDEKDLINKLKALKVLEGNPNNVKTIKFTNPLLSIHAQISRKMRQIADIQAMVKTDQSSLQDQEDLEKVSGETKDQIQDTITNTEDKISDQSETIKKLDSEIIVLKKQIAQEIEKMKKQLVTSQRRINIEQADQM